MIVALTELCDPLRAAWAMHYGVRGWVHKSGTVDELLRVIRAALRDETRIPPRLLTEVLARLTPMPDVVWATLTRRELQVFGYLVQGLSPAHIAARLQLSSGTVRTHVRNLLVKLGVQSPEQAVAMQFARAAQPRPRAAGRAEQPADLDSLFGSGPAAVSRGAGSGRSGIGVRQEQPEGGAAEAVADTPPQPSAVRPGHPLGDEPPQ